MYSPEKNHDLGRPAAQSRGLVVVYLLSRAFYHFSSLSASAPVWAALYGSWALGEGVRTCESWPLLQTAATAVVVPRGNHLCFFWLLLLSFFFFFGSAALSFLLPCRASPTGGLVAWWARSGWAGRRGGFCFHFFSFFFFPRVWFRSGFGLAWSFKSAFFFSSFFSSKQTSRQTNPFCLSVSVSMQQENPHMYI